MIAQTPFQERRARGRDGPVSPEQSRSGPEHHGATFLTTTLHPVFARRMGCSPSVAITASDSHTKRTIRDCFHD